MICLHRHPRPSSSEVDVSRSSVFRRGRTAAASALALAVAAVGLWTGLGGSSPAQAANGVPTPDHVVVVVFENHAYGQIIGSSRAPYINSLKSGGADLTRSYAETHPSQPNYFALFSGSTQGITDDSCFTPGFSSAPNLASELLSSQKTWASYNEGLPNQGSTTCSSGRYARKHNPWFGFSNVPTSSAHTLAQFPTDYSTLPDVSFVVPDLCNDMHDCSVRTGDTWLKNNLGAYATWARTHNSLLVVTFDEDNRLSGNRIATVLYGQPVTAGSSTSTTYDHYDLLRTLEDMAGLTTHAGNAASAQDITGIWAS
ncbi:acid phosphatase [Streptomyces actuosus]|uniref:Acid phosphatase n=1 Tax=Streptomyces actuosus TaxID=1885 RepID=A0ABS2VPB0_STRAS|nr:acid phosphatase [Streptomyces actuosus]